MPHVTQVATVTTTRVPGYGRVLTTAKGAPSYLFTGDPRVAGLLEMELRGRGHCVRMLDGDDLRNGLSRDLGFSQDEHDENVRRATEVASLIAHAGLIVIVSLISPSARAAPQLGHCSSPQHSSRCTLTLHLRWPSGATRTASTGARGWVRSLSSRGSTRHTSRRRCQSCGLTPPC